MGGNGYGERRNNNGKIHRRHHYIIATGDLSRCVAEFHQAVELLPVLLEQKIDTQKQDEECQSTYDSSDGHNNRGHDSEKESRASVVGLVAGRLIGVVVEIGSGRRVAGAVQLYDEARREALRKSVRWPTRGIPRAPR